MARENCSAPTAFLHEPDGCALADGQERTDGHVHVSWMVDCRNLHGQRARRNRQRRALAASDERGDRSLFEAAVDRRRSVGYRISVATHVSQNDGIWPQRRCHGGDKRRGYCHLGFAWEMGKTAGLSL